MLTDRIVRNQVNIRQFLDILEQFCQLQGLLNPIIDFIQHDVLKGHPTVRGLDIVFNRRKQFFNRESPVDFHNTRAQVIVWSM